MRKITKIEKSVPTLPTRKRVAAYARISEEKGRTLNSLSAQVSYYSAYIQKRPEWEYVGVYADSGESGTGKGKRDEFQRLIADCEAGKIDIVLTKTISRFARNTVDLLETVRRLRELGIEVRFEEQGINSMSGDGELMMTILASFAQEESRSLSENVKWAIRKGFKDGKPNSFRVYGYRWNDEKFIVHPEEAEIVKLIFDNYLKGMSAESTAKQLTEMGIKPPMGRGDFHFSAVRRILENEKYTGVLQMQKFYVESHLTHKIVKNNGELPMYIIEDAHEAIVSKETFAAVQAERILRNEYGVSSTWAINTSVLTRKIKCGQCGGYFRRKQRKRTNGTKMTYYQCGNAYKKDKGNCRMKELPQAKLYQAAVKVLGIDEFDEVVLVEKVESVIIPEQYTIIFRLHDGTEVTKHWEHTWRHDRWTPELRQHQSEKIKARFAEKTNWNGRERDK